MADTPSVPQIPDIAATQAPQQSAALDNTLSQVSRMATTPLPSPYTQGTQIAQPNLVPVQHWQPQNDNRQPISMQVQDLKRARHQNAMAGMSNSIHQFVEQTQQRKQDALKTKLVDVMQAKQNVANAQQVLQSDPNNKMAQGVMQANKKRLNDILSDPKNQKEMQKALDISFTDMDKNKTPEVQAFQQAHKEVQGAGAFNASNPAEAQVAHLAQNGDRMTTPNLPAQRGSASYQPPPPPTTITQSYQGKQVPGLVSQGNLDITKRPNIRNPDGSHSSTFSYSFGFDNGETLVPGVGDGKNYPLRKLTEKEALDQYRKTGQNFGTFKDVKSADAYAEKLHEDQAKFGSTPQQSVISRGAATPAAVGRELPGMSGGSLNIPGAAAPNVAQARSATPYADKALSRDMPTIQENPQYTAAAAQQQAAQKALWTNIIPKAMEAQMQAQKTADTQNAANARLKYAGQLAYYKTQQQHIDKLDEIGQEGKNQLKLEQQRYFHSDAELTRKINAASDLMNRKLNDPIHKQQLGDQVLKEIDGSIQSQATVKANLETQKTLADTAGDKEKSAYLKEQIAMTDSNIKDTQKHRQEAADKFYGINRKAQEDATKQALAAKTGAGGSGLDWSNAFNVLGSSPGAEGTGVNANAGTDLRSTTPTEPVGASESDESDRAQDDADDATIDALINN